jgi:hypothetical protein
MATVKVEWSSGTITFSATRLTRLSVRVATKLAHVLSLSKALGPIMGRFLPLNGRPD